VTVMEGRHTDLLCDKCGRLATGRLDETGDQLRERVTLRGWVIFECRDLCHTCAQKRGL
jgi:hypothetical protein